MPGHFCIPTQVAIIKYIIAHLDSYHQLFYYCLRPICTPLKTYIILCNSTVKVRPASWKDFKTNPKPKFWYVF